MNNDDHAVDGSRSAIELALTKLGDDAPNTKRVLQAILDQTVAHEKSEDGKRAFTDEIDECIFG